MATKVAIQGGRASFHDMAVRNYFGENSIQLNECRTFRDQFVQLMQGEVDYVVMAIENSLAGSILQNFSLIEKFKVQIMGEVYLRVQQNILALPGQTLGDINTVWSHPMALHQCNEFLESYPNFRSVEKFDTAESAREIRKKSLNGVAAIASTLAAEIYELDVLASDIENIKDNYTRFWIISKSDNHIAAPTDKATITFHVKHKVGSLVDVLNIFRASDVNLAMIQSTPIPGRPDEYAFHVDVEWSSKELFESALKLVGNVASEIHILGKYKSGAKPYDNPQSR